MKFFDTRQTVAKAVRDISTTDYDYKNELTRYDFDPYINKYNDEELLSEILYKFARNNIDFSLHMNFVTDMFNNIYINRAREEKIIYRNLIDIYIDNPELFIYDNNFGKISSAFDDKRLVLEYFKFFTQSENVKDCDNYGNISLLMNYVLEARKYYVDDRALLSSAINLIKNFDPIILKHGDAEEVTNLVNIQLEQDRKANGIYDIDSGALAEIDYKLDTIIGSSGILETLLSNAEQQIKTLKDATDNSKEELTSAKIKELRDIQERANKIIRDFNDRYLELVSTQRKSLVSEKDEILGELNREIDSKKTDLLSIAKGVGDRISVELGRVNNVTNESVRRLKEFVENDENVRKILNDAKNNDDFLARLAQIEVLANKAGVNIPDIPIPTLASQKEKNNDAKESTIVVPSIVIPNADTRQVNPKVNYYFDERIPFQDRFAQLMELKQKDIEENDTIYHEKFDDILKLIIQNQKPPYMYGPSGCGKTYMVEEQIAKLLGINIITNGYVLYEQDILGYTNSGTGGYVPSNFYRCYHFGDTIFFDELDNGIANATVVLNRFMGKNNKNYTFPDGISLNRHPNFRIIAAGNTKGNGRTLAYNTRQKMDESVMQRMTPVEVDYDNRIEMRILKDYPNWYNFAINFRKAIEEIPSNSGEEKNTIGTFTTRDAETIKMYLDDKCFDDSKIMEYEIIETKDPDYLSKIIKKMDDFEDSSYNKGGKKLLKLFHNTFDERKKD